MGVKTYKILKLCLQILGTGAGVYAIHQGADPMTVYTLIAAIIVGPDSLEMYLTNGTEESAR